jgi:c-di-GMP-binding flagellar brake protein YcgR
MAIPVSVKVQPTPDVPHLVPKSYPEAPFEAFLFDLSEFGIGLLSPILLPWGILVDLEFQRSLLPMKASNALLTGSMRMTGRVVHAIPHGGQYRIGIAFTRMDEADRHLIQQLIGKSTPPAQDRRRAVRVCLWEPHASPCL